MKSDPSLLRPIDVATVSADNTKARTVLGWAPSVSFKEMIEKMVDADLENINYNH